MLALLPFAASLHHQQLPTKFPPVEHDVKPVLPPLKDPAFLSQYLALQLDLAQYPDLTKLQAEQVGRNSCGAATVATAYNLFQHCYGDQTSSTKIETVKQQIFEVAGNQYLDPVTQEKRRFTQYNGSMYFRDLLFTFQTLGFETVPLFATQNKDYEGYLLRYAKTPELMPQIKAIFAAGGLLVCFSTRYNGHFLLLSDFSPQESNGYVQDVDLFVIDGRGWDGKGLIQATTTQTYSSYWVLDNQGNKMQTTGIMGLAGILPGDLARAKSLLG